MAQFLNAREDVFRMETVVSQAESMRKHRRLCASPFTSGTRLLLFSQPDSQPQCPQTLSRHFVCILGLGFLSRTGALSNSTADFKGCRHTWQGFTIILLPEFGTAMGGAGGMIVRPPGFATVWSLAPTALPFHSTPAPVQWRRYLILLSLQIPGHTAVRPKTSGGSIL